MTELKTAFRPERYDSLSRLSKDKLADILMMRWRAIDFIYSPLKHADSGWTYWDLFALPKEKKLELFADARNRRLPINFDTLLSNPLDTQRYGFKHTPNPHSNRDTYSVRPLQVHDVVRAMEHFDLLTPEQIAGTKQRTPFEDLLLDQANYDITYQIYLTSTNQEGVSHMADYKEELKTGALVVINPDHTYDEILEDFKTWLGETRKNLKLPPSTKRLPTIGPLKQRIISNKIIQLIDAEMLLAPAFNSFLSRKELREILNIEANRLYRNSLGIQINNALRTDTPMRIRRM